MTSALNSHYLIDGVPQEFTPAELLDAVSDTKCAEAADGVAVDETIDPSIEPHEWDPRRIEEYSGKVMKTRRILPLPFSGTFTKCRVAAALIDTLWKKGHFRLGDLALKADWKWNTKPVGSHAALYDSICQSTEYIDSLGVRISSYSYTETEKEYSVSFRTFLSARAEEDDDIFGPASKAERPKLGSLPACPSHLEPDSQSWLVYVPFETSDYRLGGSLLAQTLSLGGGVCPQISDADYFIDCYEVVRELVEDGIVLSAVSVGEGGLLSALKRICSYGPGVVANLSEVMRAFDEKNLVRLLFAEVPGVLIQIRDNDFDYIDAEFLLQDVAFFPLGHPNIRSSAVRIKSSGKSEIQTILESLMQKAEGED